METAKLSDREISDLARAFMLRKILDQIREMPINEAYYEFLEKIGSEYADEPADTSSFPGKAIARGFDRAQKQAQELLVNIF